MPRPVCPPTLTPDAGVLGGATPRTPEEACSVAFVDHDDGVVLVCEIADAFKRRNVAVHAEHAVSHNLGVCE